jgi:ankyrin repeat protein
MGPSRGLLAKIAIAVCLTQPTACSKRPDGGADESKAFQSALRLGDVKRVTTLLDRNPQLATERFAAGDTPLHLATAGQHTDLVRLLIPKAISLDAQNDDGLTPLHWAALKGEAEIARLLLEKGARPNIRDKNGTTPLKIAYNFRRPAVEAVLKEYGGDF